MSGILTPGSTYKILESIGHQPKKKLGQNFLIDGNTVRKSLELANLKAKRIVVEIGPGLGTLTSALLEAGAIVYGVEKDPALFTYLKEKLLPRFPQRLHLLLGDALEYPLAGLKAEGQESFQIIANLPYAISTPWLDAVLNGPLPQSMTLMLQQEAANRFNASVGTKNFGAISIFLTSAYEAKRSHKVSRNCFYPVPQVDSVLLHVELKQNPFFFKRETKRIIRQIFTQRRKQLQTVCRQLKESQKLSGWLAQLQETASMDPKQRAETLSLEAWQALDAFF